MLMLLVRPPSLSDWLRLSQPAVSGEADLFPIGSAASCDPTACTNLNYQVNCCVKSFLHPLVTLRCDKHSRNMLDAFSPHLRLPPSTQELAVPERLGLVFLLTRIGKRFVGSAASPPLSFAQCPSAFVPRLSW